MGYIDHYRRISTIDGLTKKQAKSLIYNLIGDSTDGFFTDSEYWEPISQIFNKLDEAGIHYKSEQSAYEHDDDWKTIRPTRKRWRVAIPIRKKNKNNDTIQMDITAHGAGHLESPLGVYDITVVLT